MDTLKKLSGKLKDFNQLVFLNLIYFIGIGLTSLIARVAGHKFITVVMSKSTWTKYRSLGKLEEMY